MGRLKNLIVKKYKEVPGAASRIYLIHVKDITNRPRTVAQMNAANTAYVPAPGDTMTIGEAFTYRVITPASAAGVTPVVAEVRAKFIGFDINTDSAHPTYETIGEKGYTAYKGSIKGEILGASGDAQREFIQDLTNDDRCIVLLELRDSGNFMVLGSQVVPVSISFKGDIGAKAGDKNHIEVMFDDNSGFLYRTYPQQLALGIEDETKF